MSGVVNDLRANIDSILGIRDDIGAALKTVSLVTRTWSGTELGDGTKTDISIQMLPTPRIVELMDDYRIKEGGVIQQGDVILKMVSKQSFPNRSDIDGTTTEANVEKFYSLGGVLYHVIAVREKHVVWEIHIRKVDNQ